MKDPTKSKSQDIPTKEKLLKDGKFVKNLYGDKNYPMYQYFDSFYVVLPDDKISKVRSIGYSGYDSK
jgi:hypothetical protein